MDWTNRTTHTLKLQPGTEAFPVEWRASAGGRRSKGMVTLLEFTEHSDERDRPGSSLVFLKGHVVTKSGDPGRKMRHWCNNLYYPEIWEQVPAEIVAALVERGLCVRKRRTL